MRTCLVALVLSALFARAAAADCPSQAFTYFGCWDAYGVACAEDAGMMLDNDLCAPYSAGDPCPLACYDLATGRLECRAGGVAGCGRGVSWNDRFTIYGPAAATLAFDVVLSVEGTVDGSGAVSGWLLTETPLDFANCELRANGTAEAVLHLSRETGVEFPLTGGLDATSEVPDPVHGAATVRFRGLPPGYYAVGCHGSLVPVPAAATSWGRVKAAYR